MTDKTNNGLLERIERIGASYDSRMAEVPESDWQEVVDFIRLAQAAVPANCNHPADGLQAFELVEDACVCGDCGAVLKNYSDVDAKTLGIAPGWNRMTAALLEAEIYLVLRPAFDLMGYIQGELSSRNGCQDAMNWGESTESAIRKAWGNSLLIGRR